MRLFISIIFIFSLFLSSLNAQVNLQNLPIVKFSFKSMPAHKDLKPFIAPYENYIKGQDQEIPPEQKDNKNSTTTNKIFPNLYNNLRIGEKENNFPKSFFGLHNPRLLEAILANGYHLRTYMLVIGAESKPLKGTTVILTGYDRKEKIFKGYTSSGSIVTLPYDYAKNNLRHTELDNSENKQTWKFSFIEEQNTIPKFKLKGPFTATTTSLGEAIAATYKQATKDDKDFAKNLSKTLCRGQLVHKKAEFGAKGFISLNFAVRMDKYKRGKTDKIGYVVVTPHTYNSGYTNFYLHQIVIEKNKSTGYIGGEHNKCGGFSSHYVLPVAVSFNYYPAQNGRLHFYLSQFSTCNVRRFSFPNYNSPAIVRGYIYGISN